MAELTAEQRNRMKPGTFAVPGKEKYPIPDREHAASALQMSHGARSGKPASASDHAAVHALVKKKFPDMYAEHMKNAHGKEMHGDEKAVPAGSHRMPDGSIMKNSDMPAKKKPTGYQMVERGLAEYRKKGK